jgi:hypothetical protein
MPDLELIDTIALILAGKEDEDSHIINVINTLSVMLYPDDENYRELFRAKAYAKIAEGITPNDQEISIPAYVLANLGNIQRLPSAGKRKSQGINAGYLLHITLKCRRKHPGWASLATAYTLLSEELNRNNIRGTSNYNISRKSLKNDWNLMRSVAHLWCAFLEFDDDQAVEPENFPAFLAWAERLRKEGEDHYPPLGRLRADSPIKKRSVKPLLDQANSWKVPANIFQTLPPLYVPTEWEPLPREALDLLARSKK